MKPYLSIIIPYHNNESTIGPLLESIYNSKNTPHYEVIVVDDGSVNRLSVVGCRLLVNKKNNKLRHLRVFRQLHNRGPAAARNRGAKEAKGKFIVFLDSDVRLFPKTLSNLTKIFVDDPDVVALTGVWVKEQETKNFFPNWKALRDWSYWINERDKSGYYYLFSTRIASIKRTVFLRLGGFDEKYPGALVEDIELTYRIARRYAIIFAPDVRVKHEFEGFWPIAKKYFLRAYYWSRLYAQRKKFDPVATTLQEAITALTASGFVFSVLFNSFVFGVLWSSSIYYGSSVVDHGFIKQLSIVLFSIPLFLICIHTFLVRKFLAFMIVEKGWWFGFRGFVTGIVLYCFISAGAFWGRLRNSIR